MDLEAAVRFVRAHADRAERLRLGAALGEPIDRWTAVRAATRGQRPDGGWAPFWARESVLDATCLRLAQADAVAGGKVYAPLQRALAFLRSRQGSDGSWQEAAHLAPAAPPWCRPGDARATAYVTANCAYWLARRAPAAPETGRAQAWLERAAACASTAWFPHARWLAAGALWQERPDIAEGLLRPLSGAEVGRLDAGAAAWLVTSLRDAGVPDGHGLTAAARVRLGALQAPDGRVPSEDGPSQDVHVTIEAIRALV